MRLQIVRHDVVASTNDEALSHARMGAPEGLCVVANRQTKGRGREGRHWSSEDGDGLYLSLLLRPELEPHRLPALTLLCAVAVYETVVQLTGKKPDIKWPNDILVDGRKIAGILLETCETPEGTAVIAGIGLNVRSESMPDGIRVMATSINDLAANKQSMRTCLNTLSQNLTTRYLSIKQSGDINSVLSDWMSRSSYGRGKEVVVTTRTGYFYGETVGLDPNGALLVRVEDSDRVIAVTAGDVMALREDDRDEDEKPSKADSAYKDVKSDQLCDDNDVIDIEKVQ